MTEYYDYVLGLIPLALFGLSGGLIEFGLTLPQAVPLAAGVAAGIVGHALFINGPVSATLNTRSDTDRSPSQSATSSRGNDNMPMNAD
ncbi:hypothetical protein [Haloquadratum walsbyi]|jgi:hypothetical protein|uniref:Uncharacterized protein n=1 Tax=Haloquadratum walsbyi J07HQW2 TaxID=1238425 RepID=U1PSW0_9EURY|nr:hypothetical protein [Haloquadratum walsbyi]ERG96867.1 MAG: hypothetical protein J07HQW2_03351 [Haloquadratum walsbyi J07HQW2]